MIYGHGHDIAGARARVVSVRVCKCECVSRTEASRDICDSLRVNTIQTGIIYIHSNTVYTASLALGHIHKNIGVANPNIILAILRCVRNFCYRVKIHAKNTTYLPLGTPLGTRIRFDSMPVMENRAFKSGKILSLYLIRAHTHILTISYMYVLRTINL